MSSSSVHHAISPASATAARDVCYYNVASLTLLVWHSLVTLDDEVRYIWTMHNTNHFKWLYFFLRYPVIIAYATHNYFIERLANGSNPPMLCRMWYGYVVGLPQTLGILLELVLAIRVFALYNRSKGVAFLLVILILVETAGAARVVWSQRSSEFYGTCLLIHPSEDGMYQCILGFSVQCTLIGLTWFKYFFALKEGCRRTPLVSLVVRDGTKAFATNLFLIVWVVIICSLESERGVAIIFWCTSLTSILGCNIILSMQRLATEIPTESTLLQFTSEIVVETQ